MSNTEPAEERTAKQYQPHHAVSEQSSQGFNINLNTIITAIGTAVMLATLSWIGSKTSDNNDKLTKMEATLPYLQASVTRLDSTVATLVTRSELDSKLLDMRATTDNKFTACNAELTILKRNIEINDRADQEAHTKLQNQIDKAHNK
jgi:hypothetical protein